MTHTPLTYEPTGSRRHGRPDFAEIDGWQADHHRIERLARRKNHEAIGWALLALGVTLITAVLAAPMIADAAFARPAICHGYATECTAAAQGEM